jgi:hypothetical protein
VNSAAINIGVQVSLYETMRYKDRNLKNGFFFFLSFLCGTGFELRAYTLSHSTSLFVVLKVFFELGSCKLIA